MDNKQREQLFEDHKHLIPKLANKYMGYGKEGVEYDDLLQESALGLHLATRDFKPEKWTGKTFESYAVTRIYQSMMEYFLASNKLYTPKHVVALASKIKKLNLTNRSVLEISRKIDSSEKEIEYALLHLKGVHFVGINETIGSSLRTWADCLPDKSNVCVIEHTLAQMFADTLNERDKAIFMMMLQEKNEKEIGVMFGFTRGRAGHLRRRLRDKFKEYMDVV